MKRIRFKTLTSIKAKRTWCVNMLAKLPEPTYQPKKTLESRMKLMDRINHELVCLAKDEHADQK